MRRSLGRMCRTVFIFFVLTTKMASVYTDILLLLSIYATFSWELGPKGSGLNREPHTSLSIDFNILVFIFSSEYQSHRSLDTESNLLNHVWYGDIIVCKWVMSAAAWAGEGEPQTKQHLFCMNSMRFFFWQFSSFLLISLFHIQLSFCPFYRRASVVSLHLVLINV